MSIFRAGDEIINKGLGGFTRVLLGLVSGGFGLAMFSMSPPTEESLYFYAIAVFCVSTSCACFFSGRVRKFFGSIVGLILFSASIGYITNQALGGPLFSARSEQSLVNAIIFTICFGVPGISYVLKARFGLVPNKP